MKTFLCALPVLIPLIAIPALMVFMLVMNTYRNYQRKKTEEQLKKEGFKWFDPNKPYDQQ